MASVNFSSVVDLLQRRAAERGGEAVISVGNLESARDFVDVRDAVRAYQLLAEHGLPGETYNVCSGRAVSIRDCLEMLLAFSSTRLKIIDDPGRRQKEDAAIQIGDPTRLHDRTGWEPRIPLEQSLRDLLDDWRNHADACG